MSVQVDIQIAHGAAFRRMGIYCVDRQDEFKNQPRHPDEIGTYVVDVQNSIPLRGEVRTATFTHRYGDDVTVLIAKAGEAIREKYGTL